MNITDINATLLHIVFDEVCRCVQNRGIRVTGTEIVRLVLRRTLIDAGKYFLREQNRSTGIPEEDISIIATKSLGLDDLKPFNPRKKVIEYLLEDDNKKAKLIDLTVKEFADEISRESPALGGRTISAYMGILGATLGTTAANLSGRKAEWDDCWEELSDWTDKGQEIKVELMHLVDEDTEAFNRIIAAFGLPKKTDEDKAARSAAIQGATLYAIQVPLHTMKAAYKAFELCKVIAQEGNPNSVLDTGVGVLVARTAILGAGLNVKINASGLKNREVANQLVGGANQLTDKTNQAEIEIMKIVEGKL